mmetsp:Transcript_8572/g.19232  ORF Transcript_8572/g.19232 Transcript_8572/m.19232 type:complete len:241 (-) Transcript_8572:1023-1745(-)
MITPFAIHHLDRGGRILLGNGNAKRLGNNDRGQSAQLILPLVLQRIQALHPFRQVEQVRRNRHVTPGLLAIHLQLQLAPPIVPKQIPDRNLRLSQFVIRIQRPLILIVHIHIHLLIQVVQYKITRFALPTGIQIIVLRTSPKRRTKRIRCPQCNNAVNVRNVVQQHLLEHGEPPSGLGGESHHAHGRPVRVQVIVGSEIHGHDHAVGQDEHARQGRLNDGDQGRLDEAQFAGDALDGSGE